MTEIFKDWNDFYARENKKSNGVSPEFAELNPEFKKQNSKNQGCWNCSDCRGCRGCSDCRGCGGCSGCSDCRGCSGCSGCSDCRGCSGCSGCSEKTEVNEDSIKIPIVKNIHSKVLDFVSKEGCFDMSIWHAESKNSSCGMTHCRGGAVICLAGEAGKKLEEQTSSEFAAMAIYSRSSKIKVSPVQFYESNEVAMADIKRCAAEEKAAQ